MTDLLSRLQTAIGYRFSDAQLLQKALTHRSRGADNYERLEFLGDGLVNFVVGEALFHARPGAGEGDLSRLRASLVCEESLAQIAAALGLGDVLHLGPGELKSGGFRRESILADALESLLGAIYIDGGFAKAREVSLHLFARSLAQLPDAAVLKDAKTRLQEVLQAQGRPLPEYVVLAQEGPPHRQIFTAGCRLRDTAQQTDATGTSRKQAEQMAAERMLELITQIQHA